MSVRRNAFGLVTAFVLGVSARAAPVDPGMKSRVDGLLGSYRTVKVAEWRALSPEAASVLEAVVRDRTALPTWRARALAALGVVQPATAGPLVRELAADGSAPVVLRSAAVDGVPGLLGAEAQAVLLPLIRDREAAVRQRSARALAGSGAAGCRALISAVRTRPASDPVARTAASCEVRLRENPPRERTLPSLE